MRRLSQCSSLTDHLDYSTTRRSSTLSTNSPHINVDQYLWRRCSTFVPITHGRGLCMYLLEQALHSWFIGCVHCTERCFRLGYICPCRTYLLISHLFVIPYCPIRRNSLCRLRRVKVQVIVLPFHLYETCLAVSISETFSPCSPS